jgi:hypothetical protein
MAHVLLAAHRVDHAAGREKEQRLEKSVRHQVENAGGKRADAHRQKHIAKLTDRGIGKHALDVGLHQADGSGEQCGGAADDRDNQHRRRRVREQNM